MKPALEIFMDASLGALTVHAWHGQEGGACVFSYARALSKDSPLSEVLPPIWERMAAPAGASDFLPRVRTIYVPSGPGMLTSLRVLFSHLIAVNAVNPDIAIKTCATPIWLNRVFSPVANGELKQFIFQVGRFAYLTGETHDPASYRTRHFFADTDWAAFTRDMPSVPTLLIARAWPPLLPKHPFIHWAHSEFCVTPDAAYAARDCARVIAAPAALKPIQASDKN